MDDEEQIKGREITVWSGYFVARDSVACHINELNAVLKQIPEKYRKYALLNHKHPRRSIPITVSYWRPETPDERLSREAEGRNQEFLQEGRERLELARLKAKYETKKEAD